MRGGRLGGVGVGSAAPADLQPGEGAGIGISKGATVRDASL
jgi:hypothetical protein